VTLRYLSGANGSLPIVSGQVIGFVRDTKKFKINEWVQWVPAPKPVVAYMILDRDHPVRVVSDAEFAWEDGDDRPQGRHNVGRFQWAEVKCERRDYAFTLGWQAQDVADGSWKPFAYEAEAHASQAMTNRTSRLITMVETSTNWASTNVATAATLNGGKGRWDVGSSDPNSPNYLAIKLSWLEAARRIMLLTNNRVDYSDLIMVMAPETAIAVSTSAEITDYLKGSPFAMAQVKGDVPNKNVSWGLPETYAGIRIVVEDASIVTERPSADGTEATIGTGQPRKFIKNKTSAVLVSRPGGIEGVYGAPNFSTVQIYHYKGLLEVQAFDDPKHERTEGHIKENFKEVLGASGVSGMLIQDVMAA
jgi:hypothetical protein